MKSTETQTKMFADEGPKDFHAIEGPRVDPQRGFPELWWKGKQPFAGVHYYPAQHKESYGQAVDGWKNQIYWGDNLQVMGHLLRRFRGEVKLIYIDPPFDSRADYRRNIKLRGHETESNRTAFEERQYTDIWVNDEYLQFMYERLALLRELLTKDGLLCVHCDPRQSHNLRCILDELFGPDRFRSEIIWQLGTGAKSRTFFSTQHNNILVYSKGTEWPFNHDSPLLREPFAEGSLNVHFRGTDETGRKYRKRVVNGKEYVYYADEGKMVGSVWGDIGTDVWTDTSSMAANSPIMDESTGYPTQKPWKLLERIISACSEPGDLVLDCFMGSGTTQDRALKLARRFIGVDINLGAVQTTTRRLLELSEEIQAAGPNAASEGSGKYSLAGFDVFTVNQYDIFRNELEARALLMDALAIRPATAGDLWHGELGEGPETRVVRIMPVNRIATRADLNPVIRNLDYRDLAERRAEHPNKPVVRITLLCMGHDPDLGAVLAQEIRKALNDPGCKLDIEVVDILRDKSHIQFKRESEAKILAEGQSLVIEVFYPMNLLAKLAIEKTAVGDWRELVDNIAIDFNYDGAVLRPTLVDIPGDGEVVRGTYSVPESAGTIRVKITDVLSEVFEVSVEACDA